MCANRQYNGAARVTRVIYSQEGFLHKNSDQPGKQCERSFASLDAAKTARFPEGCTFARIKVDTGSWVYHSARFDWEFHQL
jgi:hypothetical protein